MTNGFDDLEKAEKQHEQTSEDRKDDAMTPTFDEPATTETEVQTTEDVQDDEPSDQPAFGFDKTDQNPLYARTEAWDAFDDMLDLDLEAELRDRDLRDVPKREKHDAALRFLADHPEEIADLIESERT